MCATNLEANLHGGGKNNRQQEMVKTAVFLYVCFMGLFMWIYCRGEVMYKRQGYKWVVGIVVFGSFFEDRDGECGCL